MRAVDTNVLVRLIVRDDQQQAAAADDFVKDGAWVSLIVMTELTWVLSAAYDLTPGRIATTIEMLLEHRELAIEDADTVASALAQFRRKPMVGFADCLVLELARKAGHLPLGTFDRDLAKLGGGDAALLRQIPRP